MIKKLCVIAVFSLYVVLTACGGGSTDNQQEVNNSLSDVAAEPNPATAETNDSPAPTEQPDAEATFSATIQWDIPTTRENGNDLLLSEIGGYEVFYKKNNASDYQKQVIELGTHSQITLNNLSPGEYELFIRSYDTEGLYSQNSPTLLATIGN